MKYIIITFLTLSTFCIFNSNAQSTNREAIKNETARKLYAEASNLNASLAVFLLNKADSIEPNNPSIVHERGLKKFNSKLNDKEAFNDLNKSIALSSDQSLKEVRYLNRGLCYMEICDIESACKDWQRAGHMGLSYIEKYCSKSFDTVVHENSDKKIEVELKVPKKEASIISSNNPSVMSECLSTITIINNDSIPITLVKSYLDYGLEDSESCLYLEACNSKNKKIHFFTPDRITKNSTQKNLVLPKNTRYSFDVNITTLHQFSYRGTYKIRIVIRPAASIKGLKTKYYSNWETIIIK